MNQLRPILRGNPTRAQRLVLSSAKLDEPPSHGKSRTLAALGLSGTLLATTQAASAVTAASVSGTSAVTAAAPVIGLGLAALKGVAVGLVAGSVVYGSIVAVRESSHPSEQQNLQQLVPMRGEVRQSQDSQRGSVGAPIATTRPDVAPLPVGGVAASASPGVVQATELTDKKGASAESFESPKGRSSTARSPLPIAVPNGANNLPTSLAGTAAGFAPGTSISSIASSTAETAENRPKPKVAEQSPLESEIAILDSAQRALSSGQPAVALQDLDTHRRLFPNPHLLPEATLVRIEALLALGRSVEARKLGERLLAAHPTGALAQRVRSLLNLTVVATWEIPAASPP